MEVKKIVHNHSAHGSSLQLVKREAWKIPELVHFQEMLSFLYKMQNDCVYVWSMTIR